MGKINVAIVGVGNCASALVQGIHYYKHVRDNDVQIPGLMHPILDDYAVGDIEVVAAFDVIKGKVSESLGDAIFAQPNNTITFARDVPSGPTVQCGPVLDGIGKYVEPLVELSTEPWDNVAETLKEREVDVVINYLPVGSEEATKFYALQALQAKCAFVNCIPVFIAGTKYWANRFKMSGVPIIGDDIKSQVGATIVHRQLATLFGDRGVKLERTSQLNVGGNTDFLNMLERNRLTSKKISKTNAVSSVVDHTMNPGDIHVGPSDYVPWLEDRKWAHIRLEGRTFGDVPLNLELKLEVWDSPNSAGVGIDAIRCAKIALDRGVCGPLEGPSSYFMKSPPVQQRDDDARESVEDFINGSSYSGRVRD